MTREVPINTSPMEAIRGNVAKKLFRATPAKSQAIPDQNFLSLPALNLFRNWRKRSIYVIFLLAGRFNVLRVCGLLQVLGINVSAFLHQLTQFFDDNLIDGLGCTFPPKTGFR